VASDSATCILTSSGSVKCAGGIYTFENGGLAKPDGTASGPVSSFTEISGLSNVVALAAGSEHFCASLSSGMKCWGRNNYGQLGDGNRNSTDTSSGVSGLVDVVGIQPATISISDPGAKSVASDPFTLSATSSSGASVVLAIDSTSAAVCSIAGNTVTILDAGSCVVNGVSDPAGIYAAGSGSRTISISAVVPIVGPGSSTSITTTAATLSASVNPRGGSTSLQIEYATSESLANSTSVAVDGALTGNSAVSASKQVSGLAPGTTYYFRFSATNAIGTTVGAIASFGTTGAVPTVATGDAVPETFGAALSAQVNANEVDTTVSFEFGVAQTLVGAEAISVSETVTGSEVETVTASASNLKPGSVYYYRVVATNAVGTSRGDVKSFTTKGAKPTVTTGSASRSASGMTLNGSVNANDLDASVQFEYGTDSKLVGSTKTAAKTQSGSSDVDVSAAITGLEENTTYYYRIIASNAVGSVEGEIRSFTTTKAEGVSINDGEEFTSSQKVTVTVVGPSTAVKAILSNDGGFKTSETFDLVNNAAEIPWQLQSSKQGTFTKIVYVKYVSRFGSQSTPYTDDIILDTTKPVMTTATATATTPTGSAVQVARVSVMAKTKKNGGVRLSLRGTDTVSGIGTIEVRTSARKPAAKVKVSRIKGKADGKPRVASQVVSLKTTAKRLQVRVLDRAGNASAWRTIVVK
ncbi:MAG: hypothetical protein ACO3C5_08355, partial [Ilumatobacteraceae bacterium]